MATNSSRSEFVINKRQRTKYSAHQVSRLEREFEDNKYPDTVLIEDLAMELAVSTDRIAIWFQNRRSKFKRQSQADHVTWMRQQIFQQRGDLDLKPITPLLPEFQPTCHVLSPLESQIARREHPIDHQQSPLANGYPMNRSNYGPQPVQLSPYLPLQSFPAFSTQTNNQSTISPGQQQGSDKENREPVFRNSTHHAVSCIPPAVSCLPYMYSYAPVPYQTLYPGGPFHQTVPLTPVSRYHMSSPVDTTTVSQSTQSTTLRSFPKQLNDQDHGSASRRSMAPLQENLVTSLQQGQPEQQLSSPVRTSVEQVAQDALVDKCDSSVYAQDEAKDKELSDSLLQQKALECLAMWC